MPELRLYDIFIFTFTSCRLLRTIEGEKGFLFLFLMNGYFILIVILTVYRLRENYCIHQFRVGIGSDDTENLNLLERGYKEVSISPYARFQL